MPAQHWVSASPQTKGDLRGCPQCPVPTWHLPLTAPTGAKLDDFADFTTFGLGTALLLQPQGVLGGLLTLTYVLAVFARLCFFSSGKMSPWGSVVQGFARHIELLTPHRDPLHLPRATLPLCLSAAGQHLPAHRGTRGPAPRRRSCHDPVHGRLRLLPPRQGAGVTALEETGLCWR